MARVKPPSPELHRRLMDIPAQTQPDSSLVRSRWWIVVLIAAAVVSTVAVMLALVR